MLSTSCSGFAQYHNKLKFSLTIKVHVIASMKGFKHISYSCIVVVVLHVRVKYGDVIIDDACSERVSAWQLFSNYDLNQTLQNGTN